MAQLRAKHPSKEALEGGGKHIDLSDLRRDRAQCRKKEKPQKALNYPFFRCGKKGAWKVHLLATFFVMRKMLSDCNFVFLSSVGTNGARDGGLLQ